MASLFALALLTPAWVGVYFDGPQALGWGDFIELTPTQIYAEAPRPGAPSPASPLRATATTLRFAVGGQPVRATWGLVDGDLWIGVLRRAGDAWEGQLELPRVPTPTRLRWLPRAGRLEVAGSAGEVAFEGVGTQALDEHTFVLVHRHEESFRASVGGAAGRALGDLRCFATGRLGTICRIGVLPAGPVVDDPLLRPVAWRQHGDLMLTPWSVMLGPAGRVPHRAAPAEGQYAGAADAPNPRVALSADTLQIVAEAPPPLWTDLGDLARGTPRPSAVAWSPDDRGISRVTYGHDCQMGHADLRGELAWFPLSDGRIFLWHRQPTHGQDVAGGYVLRRVMP
ncbi:MAG: hypothetical protein R3F60_33685 [bacterium]